ncbi:DUF4321 domain-containing protein [Candidatus Desulforudis audaxviator]|uniref:DUF4321 domain-containing protein n=1 Tax=Desulforudis audaxviator (strain MP104C) TaxID=477974 RepID=B1I4S2_DESAP|nr:DUF4321 domain-containing protein [Candidatus Desulforudis audaxviator]ACA59975.1 conserved hypothetical protein [Candidatus Desulforudis audaxviator MP104C]AZK59991.1 hypothetical protein Daudx_1444 [Candidatus Desulforudis audaxviator]
MARGRNPWILIALMVLGGLAGSAVGQILSPTFPFLNNIVTAGLTPGVLDLRFMTITFGFSLLIGPLTLLGFLLGYLVYRNT